VGAIFISFTTRKDPKPALEELRRQAEYEHGHGGYTGTWAEVGGVKITSLVFDTKGQAEAHCIENADKWEGALAVKFLTGKGEERWFVGAFAAF
jgi:hypothetical protein